MKKPSAPDPNSALCAALRRSVYEGAGVTTPALRQAAARDEGVPAALAAYVHQIHAHAYKITDEEVTALRHAHDDDTLFEISVAAGLGASFQRLDAALTVIAAMDEDE